MTDPYATLGVAPTATPKEITRAYRRQLRTHHPDIRAKADADADERVHEILAAYALLRDPRRRAEYDRSMRASRIESAPIRVKVNRIRSAQDAPPLWVGPVHWRPC